MADQGNITIADAAKLDTAARAYAAQQGWALPDGSYPIRPENLHGKTDLAKAIHAIGRSSHTAAVVRAHIIKRAKAIGATDLLPPAWR